MKQLLLVLMSLGLMACSDEEASFSQYCITNDTFLNQCTYHDQSGKWAKDEIGDEFIFRHYFDSEKECKLPLNSTYTGVFCNGLQ